MNVPLVLLFLGEFYLLGVVLRKSFRGIFLSMIYSRKLPDGGD